MTGDPVALSGTWFVVPTPFHADGSLDLESQRRLAASAVGWGIDGLTVMGLTSEAALLTRQERSAALDACRRESVIVGSCVDTITARPHEIRK